MTTDNKDSPEREQTDESLRDERDKADRALAEGQDAVEEDADLVVQRARDDADAVLEAARDKADEKIDLTHPHVAARATVLEERAVEDTVLRNERALADERILHERAETARALTTERNATDRYLLTERGRSDEELANRDDFLGIVSHDLRDLLGGIALSASAIAQNAAQPDKAQQTHAETQRIQRYVTRMGRLISDLVDVASIDAGKLAVTAFPGDAIALIDEAADTFRAAAAAKGITLTTDVEPSSLVARFDHDRMLQVLGNLISNALKFTAPGGAIVIRAEPAGNKLRICVRDTGEGIASDLLDYVFERFWQVGKNDRRGLGLGLYISKCIVEAHGGAISATSTLGQGSCFCVTLPTAATRT
jgi:signal transduction histidine kinase